MLPATTLQDLSTSRDQKEWMPRFSMNDTVVVYDRIREYSHTMVGADKGTVINKAINDTLSRTIMTSLTVFLTLLILFLVGGEVTKGFPFAMLIGVITGCYS